MDFAAALEQLEKTAAAAAAAGGGPNDHNRRRGREENHYYGQQQHRNQRPRHQQQSAPGGRGGGGGQPPPQSQSTSLDALLQWGYRVAPYQAPPVPDHWQDRPKHVALLALTIDELPYEHLWRAFADPDDGHNSCRISLLCHAKFPERVRSPWLQQRLLTRPPQPGRGHQYAAPVFHTRRPEWGSIQITRAMVDLVAGALKIGVDAEEADVRFSHRRFGITSSSSSSDEPLPPVDKFLFISETCLPVCTLREFEQALFPESSGSNRVDDEGPATVENGGSSTGKSEKEENGEEQIRTDAEGKEQDKTDQKPAAEKNEPGRDEKQAADDSSATGLTTTKAAFSSVDWETSWVNARNQNTPGTPRNKYESDQFHDLDRRIPQPYRYKADQWMLLSRPHAQAIVHVDAHLRRPRDQLWNLFSRINASDEMYFPTVLAMLRILTEKNEHDETPSTVTIQRRPVTYTDWTEGMKNPATYARGVSDLRRIARLARQKGCLMARKFVVEQRIPGQEPRRTGEISVDEWKGVMDDLAAVSKEENAAG